MYYRCSYKQAASFQGINHLMGVACRSKGGALVIKELNVHSSNNTIKSRN